MHLDEFLIQVFQNWIPPAPDVVNRKKHDITLNWENLEPFSFLADDLLYKVEKNNKIPKWIVVYSGGKTEKRIDNLAPCHPHRFRLKVILKAEAVPHMVQKSIAFFDDENMIYEKFGTKNKVEGSHLTVKVKDEIDVYKKGGGDANSANHEVNIIKGCGDDINEIKLSSVASNIKKRSKWIESSWSKETWTNTDTEGTSAVCFSMAVRCGYMKQVQSMLEERPDLISMINTNNGFTPLATAVRKGDINVVRFLVLAGANVDQHSYTGQTALHLAVLSANLPITELLIDRGADFKNSSSAELASMRGSLPTISKVMEALLKLCNGFLGQPKKSSFANLFHFTTLIHLPETIMFNNLSLLSTFTQVNARDLNGLRIEHYAVDSCNLSILNFILNKGGDVTVEDSNGWTPLFRALCQGAKTEIVEELVNRGSDVEAKDRAGLPLITAARLLKNKHGKSRDSILRLVDSSYPHEKALANFTRLSKKIYNVHSLLKLV